ncbi:MAG: hypothetical protein ACNS62_03805 [Candidatus Cyclobacteriaceae bacterium M3_2C_046]
MNAITNSLAKAKYNPKLSSVEVGFNGYATEDLFLETLDIVVEIGLMNKVNYWLFDINKLSGISAASIMMIIKLWINKHEAKFSKLKINPDGKIALVTKPAVVSQFNNFLQAKTSSSSFGQDYLVRVFGNEFDAISFLLSRPSHRVQVPFDVY